MLFRSVRDTSPSSPARSKQIEKPKRKPGIASSPACAALLTPDSQVHRVHHICPKLKYNCGKYHCNCGLLKTLGYKLFYNLYHEDCFLTDNVNLVWRALYLIDPLYPPQLDYHYHYYPYLTDFLHSNDQNHPDFYFSMMSENDFNILFPLTNFIFESRSSRSGIPFRWRILFYLIFAALLYVFSY